ncbi:ComF family protein [Nesterenkonia natronophila]|nr:phosphoribosyltransferase family protein [Nesterenkonia natronophila]
MTRSPLPLGSDLDRLWFSSMGRSLRRAARQTADLLLPTSCVGCGAQAADLCPECSLDFRLLTRHPFDAEGGAEALPITEVDEHGIHLLPVTSAGLYKTLVADVVVAFKDYERIGLRRVLAAALTRSVRAAADTFFLDDEVLLVWPPTSPRARLRRGRAPVEELVNEAALPRGFRPYGQGLRRSSRRPLPVFSPLSQKGRSKRSRRAAVGQFRVAAESRPRLAGREVLLIDDVLTTGATLHGMYAALVETGALVRGAAVLAVTPRAGHESDRRTSGHGVR